MARSGFTLVHVRADTRHVHGPTVLTPVEAPHRASGLTLGRTTSTSSSSSATTTTTLPPCLANSGLAQLSTSSRSLKAVCRSRGQPRAGEQVVVEYTRRPQVCHPTSLTFTSPLVGCVRRWGPRTQPIGWVVNMARVRGHGRGSPDLQPLWWVVNMHSGPHPHLGGPASLTTSRWGRGW